MDHPAEKLIAELGGPTKVAAALQEKAGTVRMWKLRKRVPRTAWPDLIDAFPDLTLDDLKATERAA